MRATTEPPRRRVRYRKVDAFTGGGGHPSAGNPAACLYLPSGERLSQDEMLAIAKAHRGFVSEVVYCFRDDVGLRLTYYSSECEVAFCGHGTIACLYALVTEDPTLRGRRELTVHTSRVGTLTVYNDIEARGTVSIAAPLPQRRSPVPPVESISRALLLDAGDIDTSPAIIDAGLRTLIVPIVSLEAVLRIQPDTDTLKAFCLAHDVDIVLTYSHQTARADHAVHSRVFAPRFGYLEDPATGSGSAALGYHLLSSRRWSGGEITIEQGPADAPFNIVHLALKDDHVLIGGQATTRIIGEYLL